DITLNDDGAGINLERLRTKVVERGLTTADMARDLTEAELLEFLFLPGFSTASRVSEYSGRGVGLDVVLDTVRKVAATLRVPPRRPVCARPPAPPPPGRRASFSPAPADHALRRPCRPRPDRRRALRLPAQPHRPPPGRAAFRGAIAGEPAVPHPGRPEHRTRC